ncbi:MAG: DUF1549 domain-containing protein [Verrucomicrobiaceae bacterium]|nr:MAG: DUF1549 domain-containing protein [Verrucomicrobiaceae bacterium]
MKLRLLLSPLFLLALIAAPLRAAEDPVSGKIDTLVEEGLKQHKQAPNPPASDTTLVRRLYLDIIGRIPSQDEARAFTESTDPAKRPKLIDQLLASEGYVSHAYNWWSDILRVQTGQRDESGTAYAEWIKDSLRANQPYDQFVNSMVTAKGFVWDNGAVGYYVRDAGMPLDNMSNTAQIFLGTRLVCAQCHNHPFDKWTQKDYYQMAAYTYGVDTEINPRSIYRRLAEQEMKAGKKLSDPEQRSMRKMIEDILEPLKYGVQDSERQLKLPGDYKYDDAKPGEDVKAKTIFGDRANGKRDARDHYGEWLTSPQNPRFTTVIANRLWKRAFGMGLIEPVDDFKDDTAASNPALMRYLSEQIVQLRFDTKKMLRAIYNSRAYQREATRTEVAGDAPYYFPGPVLRRMTAEQVWDSICTLVIPNPDLRKRGESYKQRLTGMKNEAEQLKACPPQDIVAVARKYAETDADLDLRIKTARNKLNEARQENVSEDVKATQKKLNELNAERDNLALKARAELIAKQAEKNKSPFVSSKPAPGMAPKAPAMMDEKGAPAMAPMADAGQWKGYGDEFFRAAELPSPAPGGHFLREFGQSSREVIENSSREASVGQALDLMNGPLFSKITMDSTVMMKSFRDAKDDDARTGVLFMSLYGRQPSETERAIVRETIAEKRKDGWKDVIWALLNSREFIFVQ